MKKFFNDAPQVALDIFNDIAFFSYNGKILDDLRTEVENQAC